MASDQPEQHRDAEAVDQPGDDVAALVVGAEPVPVAERAVAVVDAVADSASSAPPCDISQHGGAGAGSAISLLTVR